MLIGVLARAVVATGLLQVSELKSVAYSLYALVLTFLLIIGTAVTPTYNPVIVGAQQQLGQTFRSNTLWIAVVMLFLVYTVPGVNTALVYQQSDVLKFGKPFIGLLGSLEGVFGVVAALFYAMVCRRLNLRRLLMTSIGFNGVATFLYLHYTISRAPFVHSIGAFAGIMSELALMDLAVRSTPRGCEALGFALMMSVRNFGIGMSDVIGSMLMDQFHIVFNSLVVVNAVLTLLALVFLPILPRAIIDRREGEALGQGS
jgi:predicted MFS family arabinose efflux permease